MQTETIHIKQNTLNRQIEKLNCITESGEIKIILRYVYLVEEGKYSSSQAPCCDVLSDVYTCMIMNEENVYLYSKVGYSWNYQSCTCTCMYNVYLFCPT